MKQIETIKEFGGYLNRYTHASVTCQCEMTLSVYLPPQSEHQQVPALYWLSGLTCTDDNFRTKAGAQRYASEHGMALVIPDTSPRGADVPDFPDRYDLGHGAGFYIDATQATWNQNYKMYSYITKELPALIEKNFPQISDKKSISGHSMGGHGALICALKNPGMYTSVSAFAPICNPSKTDWGVDVFTRYLGQEQKEWQAYDAICLMQTSKLEGEILIDQGGEDEFWQQLQPEELGKLETENNINQRIQPGYDHSYHFVATFLGEHMAFHAERLKQ